MAADLVQQWRTQSRLGKAVIGLALLLIVFAYSPTLIYNYVAPDQWRAFRYSVRAEGPSERAKACFDLIPPYYSRTGRPLVWISECVEHAVVARVSDFAYLRPVVLALVLFSAVYLGAVLAPYVGGLSMGVLAASALVMAPGYSFMVLQGMTGAMVLIALLLAAASFGQVRDRLTRSASTGFIGLRPLLAPAGIFFVACLIYPAWAFAVVGFTLIAVNADAQVSRALMLRRLLTCLLLYGVAAACYYGFERLIETVVQGASRLTYEEAGYSMSIQATPAVLIQRALEALEHFTLMPPLNFAAPHGCLPAALVLFAVGVGSSKWGSTNAGRRADWAAAVAALLIAAGALIGSVAPWLFSHIGRLETRHLIAWYLFFCATAVGLTGLAAQRLPAKLRGWAAPVALSVCLAAIAVQQYRLSRLETRVSALEIGSLRNSLDRWLDGRGYRDQRYLLAVRPLDRRPTIAGSFGAELGENAILSSAANWVQISWMINALLRERSDHPLGRSVRFEDCLLDQACVDWVLRDPSAVALGVTAGQVVHTSETPYVINFSLLTDRPYTPAIEHAPTH